MKIVFPKYRHVKHFHGMHNRFSVDCTHLTWNIFGAAILFLMAWRLAPTPHSTSIRMLYSVCTMWLLPQSRRFVINFGTCFRKHIFIVHCIYSIYTVQCTVCQKKCYSSSNTAKSCSLFNRLDYSHQFRKLVGRYLLLAFYASSMC